MIRKVSKHGPLSLSVSLPIIWVRNNNVTGGSNVQVDLQSNKLIISPLQKAKEKSTQLQCAKSKKLLEYLIAIHYRYGSDSLEVHYPPSFIKNIHEVLQSMIGFEIVDQHDKSCIIRDLSKDEEQDFEVILKRMWLVAKGMIADLCTASPSEEIISSIQERDRYINKYRAYLIRIIMKNNLYSSESYGYVNLINTLESLCDEIKDLAKRYFVQQLSAKEKAILNLFHESFLSSHALFYHFNEDKAEIVFRRLEEMLLLRDAYSGKSARELFLYALISCFVLRYKNLIYAIIELRHQNLNA